MHPLGRLVEISSPGSVAQLEVLRRGSKPATVTRHPGSNRAPSQPVPRLPGSIVVTANLRVDTAVGKVVMVGEGTTEAEADTMLAHPVALEVHPRGRVVVEPPEDTLAVAVRLLGRCRSSKAMVRRAWISTVRRHHHHLRAMSRRHHLPATSLRLLHRSRWCMSEVTAVAPKQIRRRP